MKEKKLVCLLFVFAIATTLLIGCAVKNETPATSKQTETANREESGKTTEPSAESVECLFVIPGDESKDLKEGLTLVNDKMATDGVGVTLKLKYIPWDAWDQKLNIMLSTGEKFDLFQVMNDRVSLANYASRRALADITDEIAQYGKNIVAVNPEIMMKSGQVGGIQYAIPAYWVESAIAPEIFIRKDLLKKYGITKIPTTLEEIVTAYETILPNWEGGNKPYIKKNGSNVSDFDIAHKTYDEWPFVVYDKIFYVDQEGNVKNFFVTDVFKKDCAVASDWYKRGIIDQDIMTTTHEQVNNQLGTGNYLLGSTDDISNLKTNYPDITVDDIVRIDLAPEKKDVRPYGTRNMNAVPLSSEHPEAAVKFVNWVYTSQENYDLFMYGRLGIDYNVAEPHNREDLINEASGRPGYFFEDWMIGNVTYLRPNLNCPTEYRERLYSKNEGAVDGYAAQFTFDASSVQTEYTDVMTVIAEYINPIALGVKDYDANIEEALAMLEKAGASKLIEEYKRQLEKSRQ